MIAKKSVRRIGGALACGLAYAVLGAAPSAAERPLTVAISPDIPPYVEAQASRGLEVDILKQALPEHALRFVQMPYADLQDAIPAGKVDVSAGVQHFRKDGQEDGQEDGQDDGVFYSKNFVTFVNAAISKKSAGLEIESVADLAGHPVLAWEDAYLELGPEFEKLFAPGAPAHADYVEIGDQLEQVRRFWQSEDAILVIDVAIFGAISRQLGHAPDEVSSSALFPPVTNFRVAFKDAALRDAFDRGLDALCESGAYAAILERYRVEVPVTVCTADSEPPSELR